MRRDKTPKAELEPAERKARNRTYLLLVVLAFINLYMLVWRDRGSLSDFDLAAAAIGQGGETNFAAAPNSCGSDPVRIFDATVQLRRSDTRLSEGRTLRLALLGVGVLGEEIDALEVAVREKVDLGLLAGSGAPLRVALDREGKVHALEIELAEGHLVQACRNRDDLEVRNIQHPMRADVAVVSMELGPDGLARAVEEADERHELARLVAETLAHDVDFHTESRPGDKVQLIVEKRYLGAHFHRYGRVLAVRYIGAAGRLAFYRYQPVGGDQQFYDYKSQPMTRELLRSPIAWYPVDRSVRGDLTPRIEFVESRIGAIYRRAEGAPVVALGDGTIAALRHDGDDGLTMELQIGDRVVRYSHLGSIVGDLSEGQRVVQGQVVGLVGATGRTPTPSLRLEIFEGESVLDPMFVHDRGDGRPARVGDEIPEAQRERFGADIAPWAKAMRQAGR